MDPLLLKILHITCVAFSYGLFFLRGIWMLRASPLLNARWVKVVPHVIDTLLLASAIGMILITEISLFSTPWIQAKIFALLAYITLGSLALKRGKTRNSRLIAWLAAQGIFFYIIAVAISHDPIPWRTLNPGPVYLE